MLRTRYIAEATHGLSLADARIALFNALHAKQQDGHFVLAVDDLENQGNSHAIAAEMMVDLTWLGLHWHEGPHQDEINGPYFQTERFDDVYHPALQILLETNQAYYCFCSPETLLQNRIEQRESGKPIRYPGTCRTLGLDEVNELLQQERMSCIRFKVPPAKRFTISDAIRGETSYNSDDIGDFIIQRDDAMPTAVLAHTIDDFLMQIDSVIRSEAQWNMLPRQHLIAESLDISLPSYGHCSILRGNDNAVLSTHNGGVTVASLRQSGFLPEAVLNYLARIGHHYNSDDFRDDSHLISDFSLSRCGKTPAIYDEQQLLFWQRQAVMALSADRLWHWLGDESRLLVPSTKKTAFLAAIRPNIVFPADALVWAQRFFGQHVVYSKSHLTNLHNFGLRAMQSASLALEDHNSFDAYINALASRLSCDQQSLYQPLRIAFTGEDHGPDLPTVFMLMPAELRLARIQNAMYQL